MDGMNNGQGGGAAVMQAPPQQQMAMGQMMQQQQMMPQGQMQNVPQMQQMMGQPMQGDAAQMMAQMQFNQQQMQGMNMAPGMVGGYGFSAKPQLIKKRKYRDPYREYIKVAPQNIMYDRRIVRGNTFAALVIPVNMQPDPALIEKQRVEEAYVRQKQEQMRQRRLAQERQRDREREEEREQNMQMAQMQNMNQLEELSDHHNREDEYDVYPDYRIDRAPDAVFVPNPEGEAKCTQVWEGDPLLFDYENEVEPVLQVLVGKSIEHARIEVIEEYEGAILRKHKERFQQVKEAELMETQRLEEARLRRNSEVDRRMMQMRLAKTANVNEEKRELSRSFAKGFLSTFKRDTLRMLSDLGALRRPVDLSVGMNFAPKLYSQIHLNMQTHQDHQESLDEVINGSMSDLSAVHKQAIFEELDKRQQKQKADQRRRQEEAEAKAARKKRRAQLREQHRLNLLKDQILNEVVNAARKEEYNSKMQIYDVRDTQSTDDGVILIGGFVGELIISFTCMLEYIMASPQNQSFKFTPETIEKFIRELLLADSGSFPDKICKLTTYKDLTELNGGVEPSLDDAIKLLMDPKNIGDFGLHFLMEWQKDLFLPADLIENIYRAICSIALAQPGVMLEANDPGAEATEADQEAFEKAKETNEQTEKDNATKAAAKVKICVETRVDDAVYSDEPELALVKLNNFREPNLEQPPATARSDNGEDPNAEAQASSPEDSFRPEAIPPKMPMAKCKTDTGILVALYHSEAAYAVRKLFIEHAKKQFAELEKAETSAILTHSHHHHYKQVEERFEDEFLKKYGYNKGGQFKDQNVRITFKTFLEGDE